MLYFLYLLKTPLGTPFSIGFKTDFLFSISSSLTSRDIFLFGISIKISSSFCTVAMLPNSLASGEIWPTKQPLFEPEKRPSVIRAQLSLSPIPSKDFIGRYISGIPGPPLGPSYASTKTVFSLISPFKIASTASSSLTKTFALPVKVIR